MTSNKHLTQKELPPLDRPTGGQVPPYKGGDIKKVVLIGRTNVGKSTLFNKLSEKYLAMVSSEPGTTRDLKHAVVTWQDAEFELIDSGGLNTQHLVKKKKPPSDSLLRKEGGNDINREIVNKALEAVKEADLILFVVDARDGLTVEDRDIAKWLRRRDKQILLVSNKADGKKQRMDVAEFTKLGLSEPVATSATTGSGTGDLLDLISKLLGSKKIPSNKLDVETLSPNPYPLIPSIKVAIIGRPNVGKSTLLNKMLGSPRAIVSPVPHTTREPVTTEVNYKEHSIELIDTAGMRKKARIRLRSLEKEGVRLSLKALKQADIALFVIDLSEPIGAQDQKLISEIIKAKTGLIVAANKVDLLKGEIESNTYASISDNLHKSFNFASWAPIQIISALNNRNVPKLFDLILSVNENMHRQIDDGELNTIIRIAIAKQPPHKKGMAKRRPVIKSFRQTDVCPPRFALRFKAKHMLMLSYLNYLEKAVRKNFDFTGTPIMIEQVKV